MKKSPIQKGDAVVFAASVVKRCGHAKHIADDRGVVEMIEGAVARVRFDLRGATWVPVANLARVMPNGGLGISGAA